MRIFIPLLVTLLSVHTPFAQGATLSNAHTTNPAILSQPCLDSLKKFQSAAAKGDASAQFLIGSGCEFPEDKTAFKEAVKWYRKSANNGYFKAQQVLILKYLAGEPVSLNKGDLARFSKIVFRRYLHEAARGQVNGSQPQVAEMYEKGLGTKQDYVQAYLWYSLAITYFLDPQPRYEFVQKLQALMPKMTQAQIADAQKRLEEWHPNPPDEPKYGGIGLQLAETDCHIYVAATTQGSPARYSGIKSDDDLLKIDDQPVLGMTLDNVSKKIRGKPGTAVDITIRRRNVPDPLRFRVTRASLTENPCGAEKKGVVTLCGDNEFQGIISMNTASMYLNGWGLHQDYAEAAKLYLEDAGLGNTDAQQQLGAMYEKGQGVQQSWADAYYWYSIALALIPGLPKDKRDSAMNHLTPGQIKVMDQRVREWLTRPVVPAEEVTMVYRGASGSKSCAKKPSSPALTSPSPSKP